MEKVIKNNFRILKNPHAYLQTILKTPVKFQKDWTKTVGGVKGTRYLLKNRNHAPRTTRHAPRSTRHAPHTTRHAPRTTHHGKPKTVSLRFSSKRRGTKKKIEIKIKDKKITISTFSHTKAYATKFDLDINCVKVKQVIIWKKNTMDLRLQHYTPSFKAINPLVPEKKGFF